MHVIIIKTHLGGPNALTTTALNKPCNDKENLEPNVQQKDELLSAACDTLGVCTIELHLFYASCAYFT